MNTASRLLLVSLYAANTISIQAKLADLPGNLLNKAENIAELALANFIAKKAEVVFDKAYDMINGPVLYTKCEELFPADYEVEDQNTFFRSAPRPLNIAENLENLFFNTFESVRFSSFHKAFTGAVKNKKGLPNRLFYGAAGTGKSAIFATLINKRDVENGINFRILRINGADIYEAKAPNFRKFLEFLRSEAKRTGIPIYVVVEEGESLLYVSKGMQIASPLKRNPFASILLDFFPTPSPDLGVGITTNFPATVNDEALSTRFPGSEVPIPDRETLIKILRFFLVEKNGLNEASFDLALDTKFSMNDWMEQLGTKLGKAKFLEVQSSFPEIFPKHFKKNGEAKTLEIDLASFCLGLVGRDVALFASELAEICNATHGSDLDPLSLAYYAADALSTGFFAKLHEQQSQLSKEALDLELQKLKIAALANQKSKKQKPNIKDISDVGDDEEEDL